MRLLPQSNLLSKRSHEAWIKLTLLKLLTLSKAQVNLTMHSLNRNIHAVRVAIAEGNKRLVNGMAPEGDNRNKKSLSALFLLLLPS